MKRDTRGEWSRYPRKNFFSTALRVAALLLLGLTTLFHLQFGVQALFHAPPQGVLALIAAGALGPGTFRIFRRQQVSAIVFLGTRPLFLIHIPHAVIAHGEMPFLLAVRWFLPSLGLPGHFDAA